MGHPRAGSAPRALPSSERASVSTGTLDRVVSGLYHQHRMASAPLLWTIGHSNHELEQFLALVRGAGIAYVVDVRSSPYSRYSPQFNREQLGRALGQHDIGYLFLG